MVISWSSIPSQQKRKLTLIALLLVMLIVMALVALSNGPVKVPIKDLLEILLSRLGLAEAENISQQHIAAIEIIRLPRILCAILIGGALAACGGAMQGLFRNPLADPGLIGISAGAGLGAVISISSFSSWFPEWSKTLGTFTTPLLAFFFAFMTTFLIYHLATRHGRTDVPTMLLAGIAINAFAGAITSYFVFLSDDDQIRSITFWMMGSLGHATWKELSLAAPLMLISILSLPFLSKALNAFALGEAEAKYLGIDRERAKVLIICLTAAGVGSGVAISGMIAFVGLVVPHLVRLCIGPDNRFLMLGSIFLGGLLLLLSDLLARNLLAPVELPIGIITAFIGAPFFLWLLLKMKRI
ncbi:MAG: iron chelate uptake ABC transporter family permease subunit [Verrucomicrobiota bacterium]